MVSLHSSSAAEAQDPRMHHYVGANLHRSSSLHGVSAVFAPLSWDQVNGANWKPQLCKITKDTGPTGTPHIQCTWCRRFIQYMQVEPGKPGGCFGPYNARKGGQPVRCPNRVFCVNEPSAVPWRRCGDLFWCGWLRGEMKQCGWLWGDVRWGNVVGCEMSRQCHVMWCHVIWCDVIPCVVLCHVMQCDVMWCALMWWDVICCEVTRRNGTGSSQFVMRCGWLRCHVVWFEVAVWCRETEDDLVRTTKKYKYYTVLQSTTPYYTVLQSTTPYYTVLQSTTPYFTALQTTTMYYSALHSAQYYKVYYKVLQHTTKYYLLRTTKYDSVLQNTTKILLHTTKHQSVW